MMRALSSLITATGLLLIAFTAQATPIDGVLATVNDDIILVSEFRDRYRETLKMLKAQRLLTNNHEQIKQRVMEAMVNELLELALARKQDIRISDMVLSRQIEDIARRNNMSVAEMRVAIERDGLRWREYRSTLKKQLQQQQLKQRVLGGRVRVTEQQIDRFLRREQLVNDRSEYEVAQILLMAADDPQSDSLETRAQQIYRRITSGEISFNEASARYSQASNAFSGGHLGWLGAASLPESFLSVLQDLPVGGVSRPVTTNLGVHILMLRDKRYKDAVFLTRYRIRQIFKSTLHHDRGTALAELEEARKILQTDPGRFAGLARKYSDEGLSASRGGMTNWLIQGRFDPTLESHLKTLPRGKVSGIIETLRGWYIVKVVDREQFDASQVVLREKARTFLFDQTLKSEYILFLRNLRNNAAVTIREHLLAQL